MPPLLVFILPLALFLILFSVPCNHNAFTLMYCALYIRITMLLYAYPGILLHAGLVEMVPEDFNNPDLNDRPRLKVLMFCCLSFGVGVMGLLAVWA